MLVHDGNTLIDSMGQTMTKLKFAIIHPERLPKAPMSRGFPKGKIRKAGGHSTVSTSQTRQKMIKNSNVAPWGTGNEPITYQKTPLIPA